MLRCDELTERVTDYLEGQIPLADRVEIYVHLRRCSGCRNYLSQIKEIVRLLGQLPVSPSRDVEDALLARFRRLVGPAPPRLNRGPLRLVVAD